MSDDRALDAAAEALSQQWNGRGGKFIYPSNSTAEHWLKSGDAQAAVAAYLDCLLGGLPEEAMQAAMGQASWRKAIRAFLRSLREGLGGGR